MSLSTGIEKAIAPQPDADVALVRRTAHAVGTALGARCVILFGSRARGDHRSDSDVDLAIVAAEAELTAQQRSDLRESARAAALSAAPSHVKHIDVIVWTEAEYRTKKRSTTLLAAPGERDSCCTAFTRPCLGRK